jgi:hypothetical protein
VSAERAFEPLECGRVLARTPATLLALLDGLPREWTEAREGPGTWSALDVVGHLIHGERTDWIPRARRILEHGEELPFEPFDRFAQEREPTRPMSELLALFARERAASLRALAALNLGAADLARRGRHPALGLVTLRELLATWVTHDLGHVAQISRVLAKRSGADVGPWRAYLPILSERVAGPAS